MSEGDADIIAAGGRGDPYMGPLKYIFPLFRYPASRVDRRFSVVHVCSLGAPPVLSIGEHPEIRAEFERSFRTLRSLPADIWVTAHARPFGRYRKFQERARSADSVAPFIDREGYLRSSIVRRRNSRPAESQGGREE